MDPIFHPLAAAIVSALRANGPDAYGMPPERTISDGTGNPCRHCLRDIPRGAEMLILAHRPFPVPQPYAETGPIFMCAACERAEAGSVLPPVVASRPEFLVKPYGHGHRTHAAGKIVATAAIRDHCTRLLSDAAVAHVDLRSAMNNCFICRVTREGEEA